MASSGPTVRDLTADHAVRARRGRALARLAERRRVEEERVARQRAMSRHPSAGLLTRRASTGGAGARVPDRSSVLLEVVR